MPDYVKDMLGLPTERERRSRSEPRSPRISAKRVSSSLRCLVILKTSCLGPAKDCFDSKTSKTIQIPTRLAASSVYLRKICTAREKEADERFP